MSKLAELEKQLKDFRNQLVKMCEEAAKAEHSDLKEDSKLIDKKLKEYDKKDEKKDKKIAQDTVRAHESKMHKK